MIRRRIDNWAAFSGALYAHKYPVSAEDIAHSERNRRVRQLPGA